MKGAGIILLLIGGLLLIGVLIPAISAPRIDAKKAITRHEMFVLQDALSTHAQEYGKLPEESADASVLDVLSGKNPRKLSFYSASPDQVRDHQLLDAWDRPFVFRKIAGNMIIRSAGKDGLYHTEDDITQEVQVRVPSSPVLQK